MSVIYKICYGNKASNAKFWDTTAVTESAAAFQITVELTLISLETINHDNK